MHIKNECSDSEFFKPVHKMPSPRLRPKLVSVQTPKHLVGRPQKMPKQVLVLEQKNVSVKILCELGVAPSKMPLLPRRNFSPSNESAPVIKLTGSSPA